MSIKCLKVSLRKKQKKKNVHGILHRYSECIVYQGIFCECVCAHIEREECICCSVNVGGPFQGSIGIDDSKVVHAKKLLYVGLRIREF